MSAPEGNSEFLSRDEVEGNIESRRKTKLAISRGANVFHGFHGFIWRQAYFTQRFHSF